MILSALLGLLGCEDSEEEESEVEVEDEHIFMAIFASISSDRVRVLKSKRVREYKEKSGFGCLYMEEVHELGLEKSCGWVSN